MSSKDKPRYCAECGASLEEGDAFCLKCGSQINRFIPSTERTHRRRLGLALAILLILSVCVFAVAVGLIVGFPHLLPVAVPDLVASSPAGSAPESTSTKPGLLVLTPTPLPTAIATTMVSYSPIPRTSPTGSARPSPSHTPTASATSSPTASPVACETVPTDAFGVAWLQDASLRNSLGCPTEPAHTTWSAEEHFQHGYMYWRDDLSVIYVLYDDHTWQEFRDTFRDGQTESVGYVPPSGCLEPVRGFGKVWREQLGGPRARMGWATEKESGIYSQVLAFERGDMLQVERRVYVLYRESGTWQQFAP